MAPVLFHVGPLPVYGYGVMLLMAFVAGIVVLIRELRRRYGGLLAAMGASLGLIGLAGLLCHHLRSTRPQTATA